MITRQQWNAMTPQAQWDYVCYLDSTVDDVVDDVENGEQVLISREWLTNAKDWLLEADEPEGVVDKYMIKIAGQYVELKTTRYFSQMTEKLYANLLRAAKAIETNDAINAKEIEDESEPAEEETQPAKHQPWWELPHEIDWNKSDD